MTSDAGSPQPVKGHVVKPGNLAVSEFLGELQGPASPFGSITLPLPVDQLDYTHPTLHEDGEEGW
jgi:hypothetical protein